MSIPYIPLYVADYEADTAHLTIEEDGAYMRLLRLCWRTPGCSVPDDPKWIMRKMRVSADDYYRVVEPIVDEFFTRGMGRIFNARLQSELQRVEDTHQKRSAAAQKRWQKDKPLKEKKTGASRADARQMQPEPEPEPEPKGGTPLTPFSEFWAVWPNKTAKKAAEKAWGKLKQEDRDTVLSLPDAGFAAWRRRYPRADPIHPATFLNGRRWEDEPISEAQNDRGNGKPTGAEIAQRAGERWAARHLDRGPGAGASQPLLPAGQPDRRAGRGD